MPPGPMSGMAAPAPSPARRAPPRIVGEDWASIVRAVLFQAGSWRRPYPSCGDSHRAPAPKQPGRCPWRSGHYWKAKLFATSRRRAVGGRDVLRHRQLARLLQPKPSVDQGQHGGTRKSLPVMASKAVSASELPPRQPASGACVAAIWQRAHLVARSLAHRTCRRPANAVD